MFRETGSTKPFILFAISLICAISLTACSEATPLAQVSTNTALPTNTPIHEPTDTPIPTNTPEPPRVDVNVPESVQLQPGESVTIQANATGTGKMTYEWIFVGVGSLSEETDSPIIIYTAPDPVDEKNNTAGISVIVGNEGGTTTKGVSITIVTPTPTEIVVTDTPTPTETPTPKPTERPATPPPPTPGLATPPPPCPFVDIPFRGAIQGPPVDVEVNIESILNCADNLPTATSIPLSGTYSGDLAGKELWILVYPPDIKYYPQASDACANLSTQVADGQWSEVIRLGRAGVPEAFHIVAVVTDVGSLASEDFHNYLRTGCDTRNYEGRIMLRPGATELDSIIVHTR